MQQTVLAVAATIVVDGSELDDEIRAHLDQVMVDDDVRLPAMFAISLQDQSLDTLDKAGLVVGAEVEISYGGQGAEGDEPLMKGEVVTLECEYDQFGKRVVARGYSATHRLLGGRHTQAFMNMTDGDIVKKVVNAAGLEPGDIQDTSEVYEHVTQANVSDWDFLTGRARAIGYELTVVDGKVNFRPPTDASDAPSEDAADASGDARDARVLSYGDNLFSFHGRISGAEQVGEVEARGWNDDQKKAIVASASAGTKAATLSSHDPAKLAGTFGTTKYVAVDESIASDGDATTIASAYAERFGSAFARADGVAAGNTKLRAGTAVRITGVGSFNGAYVLTRASHVIDGFGYRTQFWIGGRQTQPSETGPQSGGRAAPQRSVRTPSVVRAIVDDNADPQNGGRVKVQFPWLDDEFRSGWAPVVQLGAGPQSGTLFLPAVGDEVLVGFEQGDVGRPVVLGGLFNGKDTPPTYSQWLDNGAVKGRAIYSRKGHAVTFLDGDDSSGITLGTAGDEVSIGLNAKDQKLVFESQGAFEVSADGEIKVHGSKITLEADGEVVLKGTQIKLN
jgi:uncharacterized protein involved in type VI secretion and phage assembly